MQATPQTTRKATVLHAFTALLIAFNIFRGGAEMAWRGIRAYRRRPRMVRQMRQSYMPREGLLNETHALDQAVGGKPSPFL